MVSATIFSEDEMTSSSIVPGRPHLSEHLLLRDTLYLLQGISGKYVRLSVSDDTAQNKLIFVEDLVSTLYIRPKNQNY